MVSYDRQKFINDIEKSDIYKIGSQPDIKTFEDKTNKKIDLILKLAIQVHQRESISSMPVLPPLFPDNEQDSGSEILEPGSGPV